MKCSWLVLAPLALLLWCGLSLQAASITYTAQLFDAIPVTGSISQPYGSQSDPIGAVYYFFGATAGSPVTVFGDRLDGPYDMSFWIFQGLFADTSAFGPSFDPGDPGYIDFGDDEDPPNLAGPYGDPRSAFTAPGSGFYTVAVTNYYSSGSPPYDFQLQADGVNPIPEPSTFSLVCLGGLIGAGFWWRRKRAM